MNTRETQLGCRIIHLCLQYNICYPRYHYYDNYANTNTVCCLVISRSSRGPICKNRTSYPQAQHPKTFETSRKMPTILQPKLLIPRILKPIILQPENLGKLKKCGRDLQCLGTLFCSYPMDDQRPPRKCLLLWSASKSSWRWTARAWEATRATAWDLPSIKKRGRYGGLGNNEEGLCWGFIII